MFTQDFLPEDMWAFWRFYRECAGIKYPLSDIVNPRELVERVNKMGTSEAICIPAPSMFCQDSQLCIETDLSGEVFPVFESGRPELDSRPWVGKRTNRFKNLALEYLMPTPYTLQ